jgi:DNA modification methylase
MDTGQALTRFFQRDSTQANNLTLYPHKEDEFWLWVSTWALFITKPSDLGYDDTGYDLPQLDLLYHKIAVDHAGAGSERDGQMLLLRDAAMGLKDAAREKRDSISQRVANVLGIVKANLPEQIVVWCHLNDEQDEIERALKSEGISVASIYGSLTHEEKEQRLLDWKDRKYTVILSKPEILGSGANLQQSHIAIFAGIDYSFNDTIQAVHRIHRFLQLHACEIHFIYMESEGEILKTLLEKWRQHDYLVGKMIEIIKKYGLSGISIIDKLARSIGVERVKIKTELYTAVNNDCVLETSDMPENSIDLIHTSIPFSNHYEYTPSYNDFGHNEDTARFFEQMDFLSPQLLRVLKPGRVFACHVKDRVLFGNATGTGMPTIEPFHAICINHYTRHGFQYFGMITVVTDVVRENNQTYRLGWTEQCKDGSKMGVGCPEYILLFRKLPSNTGKAYADDPVTKTKDEYTRAQWQIDAHGYWRSSGDRLLTKEELGGMPVNRLQAAFRKYSREAIYSYEDHVALAKKLDKDGKLPASFMVVAPGSWTDEVWDDINRMRTLNTEQSQRRLQMHVCPLQIDIVERIINRYSNKGDVVLDPFGGLMTVPVQAVKMGRKGYGIELNADYFRDGIGYLRAAEATVDMPTLFDLDELSVGAGGMK